MIVAFTGKMGVGKSTAVAALETAGYTNIKFADKLYELSHLVRDSMGLPREKDRVLLQLLGTEWGRNTLGSDIWVNKFKEKVRNISTDVLICCDDCRFDNEAEAIKELGGLIIRIVGESNCEQINATHASEKGISDEYVDIIVHNYNLDKKEFQDRIVSTVEVYRALMEQQTVMRENGFDIDGSGL